MKWKTRVSSESIERTVDESSQNDENMLLVTTENLSISYMVKSKSLGCVAIQNWIEQDLWMTGSLQQVVFSLGTGKFLGPARNDV